MSDTIKLELPVWANLKKTHKQFIQQFTDYLDATDSADVLDLANKRDCGMANAIADMKTAHNSVRRTMRGIVGKHHTVWALNGYHIGW